MLKRFPHNNFFLMVTTGAKGSTVNFSMIACCLGQMELEGRRVARTTSGRTLPSFKPYEIDVVAGGFISQRFLTGVKPREFYFHCMAGREGLVDTAVKTSRSGYLQRCIIKHLESVTIAYDGTVRDTDGSIVQFAYGEDGLDCHHHQNVHNIKLWKENASVAKMRIPPRTNPLQKAVRQYHKHYAAKKLDMPVFTGNRMRAMNKDLAAGSLIESFTTSKEGVVSDKFLDLLQEHGVAEGSPLYDLMVRNYQRLLVPPGESVGVLAGQSIGEPSTQMTLNTFHLAGHGDVNVTLGIPRLRELLMGATTPKIPSMTVEIRDDADPEQLKKFKSFWKNDMVDDIVAEVVCSRVLPEESFKVLNYLYFKFDEAAYEEYGLSWDDVVALMRDVVSQKLFHEMLRDLRSKNARLLVRQETPAPSAAALREEQDGDDGDIKEVKGSKKKVKKEKKRKNDNDDDDEEELEDFGAKDEEEEEEKNKGDAMEEDDDDSFDFNDLADVDGVDEAMGGNNNSRNFNSYREWGGMTDKDGFLSENIPEKILNASMKQEFVAFQGISAHAKQKVVKFKLVTKMTGPQVLISSLAEWVVKNTPIRIMPGLSRTLFVEADGDKRAHVITQGCNIPFVSLFQDVLDVAELKCNYIGHIREIYGVEAARTALVEELAAVFAAYGISVGSRHLTLIADYQTFHGGYRGFNRFGMSSHKNSPFLNMSFETTTKFASEAALHGAFDDCTSSAAQLVMGIVPSIGTGCMDILQPLSM
jgi:DNA-directed RNA polymerase I subunit RPA1